MKAVQQKQKPTILVIEDNADQWFLVRWALLQRFPEIEAVWMPEPERAFDYLETCSSDRDGLPKLVLLDLYLPKAETGWNTLQILKTHNLYRHIPTIVLSQSSDPEDIEKSYRCHTNLYITKPGNYQEWIHRFGLLRQSWWDTVHLPTK